MSKKPQATESMYQMLVRPMVTEKTTRAAEANTFAFEVCGSADKNDIKAAVEALYKVDVTKVNTMLRKGKAKRFRGVMGRRSDMKIAMVRLKDGQAIDVASGV